MERITVIFDFDGTLYQDTAFIRPYIAYLCEGTPFAQQVDAIEGFARDVLDGLRIPFNAFYRPADLSVFSSRNRIAPADVARALDGLNAVYRPDARYGDALADRGLEYLGDAWALMRLIAHALDLDDPDRTERAFRLTRAEMGKRELASDARLAHAVRALSRRARVVLMSNSYRETVEPFIASLGFAGAFPLIVPSADKPYRMVENLVAALPDAMDEPSHVLSIGDHAFNDLMPIRNAGGFGVWANAFPKTRRAPCGIELRGCADIADFIDSL